ncbi:hypothetical protein BU17DRAFT_64270 [Hysterangium stoloniferum]|nr:hypothetical protein BU17DRAFT_64270 [Hysterangium stoloniferum]
MVYLFPSLVILLYGTLSVLASPLEQRTVAEVLGDIRSMNSSLITLKSLITSLPNKIRVLQGVAIGRESERLLQYIHQGTEHVKFTKVTTMSAGDAPTIFQRLNEIEPLIFQTLDSLVTKKYAIMNSFPDRGKIAIGVEFGLTGFEREIDAFAQALIVAVPEAFKAQGNSFQTAVDSKISKAIAAYTNRP